MIIINDYHCSQYIQLSDLFVVFAFYDYSAMTAVFSKKWKIYNHTHMSCGYWLMVIMTNQI